MVFVRSDDGSQRALDIRRDNPSDIRRDTMGVLGIFGRACACLKKVDLEIQSKERS